MSTLRVDNVTPAAGGTAYSLDLGVAKTHANFDMETASFVYNHNYSSLTDNGVGVFDLNYVNNISAINSGTAAGTAHDSNESWIFSPSISLDTTSSHSYTTANVSPSPADADICFIVIFAALA